MRRLTGEEVAAYDLVPAEVARRARVQRIPFLTPGMHGMTVGRFVFLLRDDERSGSRRLLAHELVHVQQYRDLGTVRFLRRYVSEYVRNLVRMRNHPKAYRAISLEVEARRAAAEWAERSPR